MELPREEPTEQQDTMLDFSFSAQPDSSLSPEFVKKQRLAEKRCIAADWLNSVLGARVPIESDEAFRSGLSDGVILCKLLNALQAGTIPRIIEGGVDSSTGEVIQTFENVSNFIKASQHFTTEVFSARDLEVNGERPQVVECLLSLKDWQAAASQAGLPSRSPAFSSGSPFTNPSPSHSSSSLPSPMRASFSFTPVAQEFVQKHGTHTTQADGGIPLLMRSCTNMLKSKMGMPVTPNLRAGAGNALQTENALEAVGPVLESVLANLTAEYEKRLLAKDQEMKLAHEAMDRMRKKVSCLQEEVACLHSACAQMKALPAHPTDGLTTDEREEYEERLRAEREAAKRRLQEAEIALRMKEEIFQADILEKDAELEDLREELDKHQDVQQRLAQVREENRLLYNTVQDLRGNIRVFCRVRPHGATGDSSQVVVDEMDDQQLRLYNPKTGKDSTFKFDRVFGQRSTQEDVYDETKPLIRSVLDGYNVCIFAYGQTGSGKTHTMSGTDVEEYTGRGINYRALDDLFNIQLERVDEVHYDIHVQMLEIYNESLRDLLVDEAEARKQKSLELRDTQRSGFNVPDAIQLPVACTADVLKVMTLGARNRAVAETKMNERSSRSHSVLTVTVDGTNLANHEKTHGCLHLIDLAGSERVGKSGAEGDQLKEAMHINTSLSALGNVMTSLANKAKHVPFRNSKLTRLLEDSLSGQAKSMMFIHVAPEWNSASETRCTLDFGKRVTEVTLGAAKKNTESAVFYKAEELERKLRQEQQKAASESQRAELEAQERKRLEAELECLRSQLSRQALSSANSSPSSSDGDTIRAYRPVAAARLSGRIPTPQAGQLMRPESSASVTTPRGATTARTLTPRGSIGASPRGATGVVRQASMSRLNLAAVEKMDVEKPKSGLKAASMTRLNLGRIHSSEENNTPQSAAKVPGLSKIPTPVNGSLTARTKPEKASPFSSIPRPQTARESLEEAKARRAALPGLNRQPTMASSQYAKPSVSQIRNTEASSRTLGRANSSTLNSDGSLNSARSFRSNQSATNRAGRWN